MHGGVLIPRCQVCGLGAVEGAVIVRSEGRGVSDDRRFSPSKLGGEVAELTPQQWECFPAGVNSERGVRGDHHVALRLEQVHIEGTETHSRLPQIRSLRLFVEVVAHNHSTHTDGAKRLRIDASHLAIQPPNRLRVHQRNRITKREAR